MAVVFVDVGGLQIVLGCYSSTLVVFGRIGRLRSNSNPKLACSSARMGESQEKHGIVFRCRLQDVLKIGDFGLSRHAQDSSDQERGDVGTAAYCAPEGRAGPDGLGPTWASARARPGPWHASLVGGPLKLTFKVSL